MIDKKRAHATLFALCCVVSAIGQTSPDQPAPAPAPPPPAPAAWKVGGVDVSGMINDKNGGSTGVGQQVKEFT